MGLSYHTPGIFIPISELISENIFVLFFKNGEQH